MIKHTLYICLGYSKIAAEPYTEILIKTFMKDSVEETDISMVGLEIGGWGIYGFIKSSYFSFNFQISFKEELTFSTFFKDN